MSARLDVLAVMTPGDAGVVEVGGWRHIDSFIRARSDGTADRIPIYRAEIRFAGEPKRTALIDADKLAEARDAVAELIEAASAYRDIQADPPLDRFGRTDLDAIEVAFRRMTDALARYGAQP